MAHARNAGRQRRRTALGRLRASPAERILAPKGEQQILATAAFSDGSLRDVTSAAGYVSNAALVAETGPDGRIRTGTTPGEAAITVHYMGEVAVVRLQVPRPNRPEPYPEVAADNRVTSWPATNGARWESCPSPLADDATFFRRLNLDVAGTLPTPNEVRAFLADSAKDKRPELSTPRLLGPSTPTIGP